MGTHENTPLIEFELQQRVPNVSGRKHRDRSVHRSLRKLRSLIRQIRRSLRK
jgi:hypothetical protein